MSYFIRSFILGSLPRFPSSSLPASLPPSLFTAAVQDFLPIFWPSQTRNIILDKILEAGLPFVAACSILLFFFQELGFQGLGIRVQVVGFGFRVSALGFMVCVHTQSYGQAGMLAYMAEWHIHAHVHTQADITYTYEARMCTFRTSKHQTHECMHAPVPRAEAEVEIGRWDASMPSSPAHARPSISQMHVCMHAPHASAPHASSSVSPCVYCHQYQHI